MGNTVTCVTPVVGEAVVEGAAAGGAAVGGAAVGGAGGGGKGGRKIRVLLPEGEIALLDGPLDAADLMMEHLNHMVVHCSTAGSAASTGGKRGATMTIMQPHERLEQGQNYVVHPIPSKYSKTGKFQKPQPFSIPSTNLSTITVREDDCGRTQEKPEPHKKAAKLSTVKRFKKKVADSAETPELRPDAPRSHHANDARVHWQDQQDHGNDEGADEEDDAPIVFNLNMHMGWRPALESIPESPIGSGHQLDLVQGPPPVLCI